MSVISTQYGSMLGVEILCDGDDAILNGFINLINTLKDSDGISERVFRPNVGSNLQYLLQDPMDDTTAFQLKLAIQNLVDQSPRYTLSSNTSITANKREGYYDIRLVLINNSTGKEITGFFNLASN